MITINYSPATLEDFKAACEYVRDNGFLGAKAVRVTPPKDSNGDAPSLPVSDKGIYEIEWLRRNPLMKRMRLTDEEKERVDGGAVTKEDIAKERLDAMGPDTEESAF